MNDPSTGSSGLHFEPLHMLRAVGYARCLPHRWALFPPEFQGWVH